MGMGQSTLVEKTESEWITRKSAEGRQRDQRLLSRCDGFFSSSLYGQPFLRFGVFFFFIS